MKLLDEVVKGLGCIVINIWMTLNSTSLFHQTPRSCETPELQSGAGNGINEDKQTVGSLILTDRDGVGWIEFGSGKRLYTDAGLHSVQRLWCIVWEF